MGALGDEVFLLAAALVRDGDLAVAADEAADLDGPVDLGDDGRELGPPGLEELLGPGQAARDVLGAGRLAGDLGQDVAGEDLLAVLDLEVGPRGQEVLPQEDGPALVVRPPSGSRISIWGWSFSSLGSMMTWLLRPVNSSWTSSMLTLEDDVVEADGPGLLGQDEGVEGIPLGEGLAGLDLLALARRGSWRRRAPGSARPRGRGGRGRRCWRSG